MNTSLFRCDVGSTFPKSSASHHNAILHEFGLELRKSHEGGCALSTGHVSFKDVRLDVHIEGIAADTLYGVVKRQNAKPLSVLNVLDMLDMDEVVKLDARSYSFGPFLHQYRRLTRR